MKLVSAKSLEDYFDRYHRPAFRTPTLLQGYRDDLAERGYVCTSSHENVTGEFICWPKLPYWSSNLRQSGNKAA